MYFHKAYASTRTGFFRFCPFVFCLRTMLESVKLMMKYIPAMKANKMNTCVEEANRPIRIIPLPVNSSMATAHRKEVSFTVVIICESRDGTMFLKH